MLRRRNASAVVARLILLSAAIAVAGCDESDPVVARVGDAEISLSQVERFVERLPRSLRSRDTSRVATVAQVWSVIDHHLLLQEARNRGLDTLAALRREAADHERRWLARLYLERSGILETTVTAQDVEQAFSRWGFDEQRLLRRVVVTDEDRLAEALERIRSGAASLADVVRSHGAEDALAQGDGTVGWVGREDLVRYRIPEKVFFSFDDGRIAPVADLGGSWQIYLFDETRSRDLVDVWDRVHDRLLRERKGQRTREEYEKLIRRLDLRMSREGLEAALKLGGPGLAPPSLKAPAAARVLYEFDGGSVTVGDFFTVLLRLGFRGVLADSSHVAELAESGALEGYLFAAAARREGSDEEPEFRTFAHKKMRLLMLEALEQQELEESEPITDEEVRGYYERNPGGSQVPESVVIRRLYVETLEEASALREEIDSGVELASLLDRPSVAEHVDPRIRGVRRLFRIHRARFPELVKAAFAADPGDVVGPVPLVDGFAVFEVLQRKAAEVRPYEEARQGVRRMLLAERKKEAMAMLIRRLREEHEGQVTVYDLPDEETVEEDL